MELAALVGAAGNPDELERGIHSLVKGSFDLLIDTQAGWFRCDAEWLGLTGPGPESQGTRTMSIVFAMLVSSE